MSYDVCFAQVDLCHICLAGRLIIFWSVKLVVFRQLNWSYLEKLVVWRNVPVAKLVVLFGETGRIWRNWSYLDKIVIFGQTGVPAISVPLVGRLEDITLFK